MKLEVEEEQEKHDVWGSYVRLHLPDDADFEKKYGEVMRIISKYKRRNTKARKDGVEVPIGREKPKHAGYVLENLSLLFHEPTVKPTAPAKGGGGLREYILKLLRKITLKAIS